MAVKYIKYLENIIGISDVFLIVYDVDNGIEEYSFIYRKEEYKIVFENSFPGKLPQFIMKNPRKHLHVAPWGTVCIDRVENIDFDVENIQDIINKSFNSFFNVMSQTYSEKDYLIEYGDYLKYYKAYSKKEKGFLLNGVDLSVPHFTNIFKIENTYYISDSSEVDSKFININASKSTYIKALYLPLKQPFEIKEINSRLYLNDIKNVINSSIVGEINNLLKKKNIRFIFISINNLNGINILLLLELGQKIESLNDNIEIVNFLQLNNLTIDYLKERGSTKTNKSKILLIGCGSIGSEILYHLCKNGYDNIDICDFDVLKPENIYRHFLGYNSSIRIVDNNIVQLLKTTALKYEMMNRYPSVDINTFNKQIEECINNNEIDLASYDYIINATGNMISNRYLNNFLYKNNIKSKVIYSWLEPYGIAMHLFINDTFFQGCLNCLLKSSSNVRISQEDNYLIQNDNCIGSYTKFGSLEVSRLAIDVVRTILNDDFIINKHKILFGDFKEFLNDGYKLTRYSDLSEEQVNKIGKDIVYEGCPICRNHSSKS